MIALTSLCLTVKSDSNMACFWRFVACSATNEVFELKNADYLARMLVLIVYYF